MPRRSDTLRQGLQPVFEHLAALPEPEATLDWTRYDSEVVDATLEAGLLRILGLYEDDALTSEQEWNAATHAWRLLARHGTAACVPQLVAALAGAGDEEWGLEELPTAIARFGAAAVPELRRELLETPIFASQVSVAAGLIMALERIASEHESERPTVCAILRQALRRGIENPPDLNAFLIGGLLTLRDVESLPEITAAFAHDAVSTRVVDWSSIQEELGIAAPPPTPVTEPEGLPAYSGDVVMQQLLRSTGSHMQVPELRCLMLGSILAVETVPPSRLFAAVMRDHDDEPVQFSTEGQARRVLGQVMALWNEMTAFQDALFELPALPDDAEDLGEPALQLIRALIQRTHLHAFLDGFEMGSVNVRESGLWREFTVQLQRGTDHITRVADAGMEAAAPEVARAIADVRQYWASNYLRFAESCKTVRRERLRKHQLAAAHRNVGRNDPCPCGSSKKFKYCCLQ